MLCVPAAVSAADDAAYPPNANVLSAADPAFGGWTPLVKRLTGSVSRSARSGGSLTLSDRGGPAGYVVLGTTFAPRSSVVNSARLNLTRQVLAIRRARPLMEIGSTGGTSVQAGAFRATDGLRWAVWVKQPNGMRRHLVVSGARVKTRTWATVSLVAHVNRARGGASLRVNGEVVARTKKIDMVGLTASRASVGLGAAGSRREVGTLVVKTAATWGTDVPGASAGNESDAPQPGAPAPAATTPPGGSAATPVAPATPAPGTTPAPRTPRTTPPAPVTPRPAPGPASPPPPPGTIPGTVFSTVDFQSGSARTSFGTLANFGGISSFQASAADRIQSVASGDGRVGRFEVQNGDVPVSCCGERAEVSVDTNDAEGQERWYTWATMFDQSFISGDRSSDFQVVTQFHSRQNGQPPVAFYAEGELYRLQVWPKNGDGSSAGPPQTIWSTPIVRGKWYRIALHVKWSGNDSIGFVELFVDGQPAGVKTSIRTLYPGYTNYLKLGAYRDGDMTGTSVVYHDDVKASNVP